MPTRVSRPTSAAGHHRLLGDPTRLAIINALRTAERTVADLAEVLGVHRNTVRSHLERLGAAGVVESSTGEPAGRGRPAHTFRLVGPVETGHQTPFTAGLAMLVRRGHGHSAARAAEEQGRIMGASLGASPGSSPAPRTDSQAVDQAAAVLQRLAFDPAVRRRRGGYQIDILHCPYWGLPVSSDGDILCGFHRGLMQGMVDVSRPGRFAVTLLPLVQADPCRCEIRLDTSGPC